MFVSLELEDIRIRTSRMKHIDRAGRRQVLFTKGREGIWTAKLTDYTGQVGESFLTFGQVPYLKRKRSGATFTVFAKPPQDRVVKLELVVPGGMNRDNITRLVQHLQLAWQDMWHFSGS